MSGPVASVVYADHGLPALPMPSLGCTLWAVELVAGKATTIALGAPLHV